MLQCEHSNETSSAVLSHVTTYLVCSSNFYSLWMKSCGVTIQMKPLQQYLHIIPFVFLILTLATSVSEEVRSY